ncbi:kinase-like domain-containing protein [Gigaspora rosea]|uniref:Kinase-like domain-containing protein n=1 Tax=Gigaspora rosea TaxID=44941 RepID=A0A397V2V8_9GLOM|nr:kinase-like domain-containing protein [Gigaspora rosea]
MDGIQDENLKDSRSEDYGICSGNKEIDEFLKESWLSTKGNGSAIEFIQYNRIENLNFIGEGGFSRVFSAIWLDGARTVKKDLNEKYIKARGQPIIVALKFLINSQNTCISNDFVNEIRYHFKCFVERYASFRLYGISQEPTTKEYILVTEFAEFGDFRNYLASNFNQLKWVDKLSFLRHIIADLTNIHFFGYLHKDLHTGNILVIKRWKTICASISDLGLSQPADKSTEDKGIYGILPYVAPEILCKQQYTKASDIYSFGVIMAEVSTGAPPFDDIPHNAYLANRICKGLRPRFAEGTPECYMQLANKCMDANPFNRPIADDVYEQIKMMCFNAELKKEFEAANMMIPKISTSGKHTETLFSSRSLDFQNLPKPVNSTSSLNIKITAELEEFEISYDDL